MTITERPLVFASEVEKRRGVALRGDGAYIWLHARACWVHVTFEEIDQALQRDPSKWKRPKEAIARNIAIGKKVGSYP